MALNYEKMDINDIINYCAEHDALDWLEKELNKTVTVKRYSERKPKLDKDGNQVLNKKGYPIYVADKKSPVVKETQAIAFMQVKRDFIEHFELQSIKPEPKKKAPTMLDLLAQKKASLAGK